MRTTHRRHATAISALLATAVLTLCLAGYVRGGWRDSTTVHGRAKMGCWKSCVRVRKALDGAYTDPLTGEPTSTPNRTHIAVAANFSTLFRLTICVENYGSLNLSDVVLVDTIKNTVAPTSWTASVGTVTWSKHSGGGDPWDGTHFGFNKLTWQIGDLEAGETACLHVWLATLRNPAGKHEPTSGDEGDAQDIEFNEGATVTAASPFAALSASTEGITLMVTDDGVEGNGLALIDTPLPHSTPWAEDRNP